MKLNQKNSFKLIEAGTILCSVSNYNGLIIEYQLGSVGNRIDLYMYFKLNDIIEDYSIGLTLNRKINKEEIRQNVYLGDKNKIITRNVLIQNKIVMLIDKVSEICKKDMISVSYIKINNKEINEIDFWIYPKTQHHDDVNIIKIPNLINYRAPKENININEAYPKFNKNSEWWKYPNPDKLNKNIEVPIIDWKNKETKMIEYDKLIQNLKLFECKIKNIYLDIDHERLGYWLYLKNNGPQTRLYLTSNQNLLYSFKVPEKVARFKHFVGAWTPVQIHLHDFNGPILTQSKSYLISTEFLETYSGLWIYIANQLETDQQFKINAYKHDNQSEIIFNKIISINQKSSHKEQLTIKDSNVTIFKIYIINNDKHKLVSQYAHIRNIRPQMILEPLDKPPLEPDQPLDKPPHEPNQPPESQDNQYVEPNQPPESQDNQKNEPNQSLEPQDNQKDEPDHEELDHEELDHEEPDLPLESQDNQKDEERQELGSVIRRNNTKIGLKLDLKGFKMNDQKKRLNLFKSDVSKIKKIKLS